MSALLDTLLEDTRRMEVAASRKNDGPIKSVLRIAEPVTRADKIIAAGNTERVQYRAKNPTADSAMVYGAQIGHLHGEVRRLCGELENFEPTKDKSLGYATVFCVELDCDVLVGFDYSAGEDSQTYGPPENCYEGSPEALDLCEVWVNGIDIAAVLLERVAEQLTEAALAHVHDAQENARYGDEP